MRFTHKIVHVVPPPDEFGADGDDVLLHAVQCVKGVVEHESDSQGHMGQCSGMWQFRGESKRRRHFLAGGILFVRTVIAIRRR